MIYIMYYFYQHVKLSDSIKMGLPPLTFILSVAFKPYSFQASCHASISSKRSIFIYNSPLTRVTQVTQVAQVTEASPEVTVDERPCQVQQGWRHVSKEGIGCPGAKFILYKTFCPYIIFIVIYYFFFWSPASFKL